MAKSHQVTSSFYRNTNDKNSQYGVDTLLLAVGTNDFSKAEEERNTAETEKITSMNCIWLWKTLTIPKIKAESPQTNGICERFNRTVQNEFYAIAFRKKIYTSIEQLQADLNAWINSYNTQRTHSGKYCFGKTPMQTFIEGIAVARKYQLQNQEMIKPNEHDKISCGCESEECCVTFATNS